MKFLSEILAKIFDFWHGTISLALPPSCRFEPTCSVYGAQALRKHGLFKGLWLTLKRLSKCHPWGPHGHDPVP